MLLAPFWGIDLRLPHLPFVGATDASGEFGIGAAISQVSAVEVAALARIAERDGEYVTVRGIEPKIHSRSLGSPQQISKRMEDFTAIFSIRCDNDRHINLREADAVVHCLKWMLRSRQRDTQCPSAH